MTRWAASGMACNYAQKTAFNALKKLFLAVSFPLRGDTSMDGSPHRVLPALCDPTSGGTCCGRGEGRCLPGEGARIALQGVGERVGVSSAAPNY